jgi:hypothetical protein
VMQRKDLGDRKLESKAVVSSSPSVFGIPLSCTANDMKGVRGEGPEGGGSYVREGTSREPAIQ